METNSSTMVFAAKYKLLEPLSLQEGTWNPEGRKKLVKEVIIPRRVVEDRNAHNNNELWVIDEEKTAALMKEREQNIIKNAEKAKKERTSTADLVDAIVSVATPKLKAKSKDPDETWSTGDLKEYLDDLGVDYDKRSGAKKLLELIKTQGDED